MNENEVKFIIEKNNESKLKINCDNKELNLYEKLGIINYLVGDIIQNYNNLDSYNDNIKSIIEISQSDVIIDYLKQIILDNVINTIGNNVDDIQNTENEDRCYICSIFCKNNEDDHYLEDLIIKDECFI